MLLENKQSDMFFDTNDAELGWLTRHDANVPEQVRSLVQQGAIFFINHSGGKDSQAMYHFVRRHVPAENIIVVHADLPEVDWDGVIEHIQNTIGDSELLVCRARRTLLKMVEERGMFPSPRQRFCTSDLKRGPIEKVIRHTGHKLIVNCMGMRAQESEHRSEMSVFKFSERNSKNQRKWFEWLPIHTWDIREVFAYIKHVGQEPHWAYAKGMSRLSCVFCIMASKQDLITAARLKPDLYKRYVDLEKSTGQVMMMPSKTKGRQTLEDITGILAT
jgi:DNA sulfur modification protein DndC